MQGTDIWVLCATSEVEEGQDTAAGRQERDDVGHLRNMHRCDDQLRVATAQGALSEWKMSLSDGSMRAPCFDACDCGSWTKGMNGTCGGDGVLLCRCGCARCRCGERRDDLREWRQ